MYYECHITMEVGPKTSKYAVELMGWKFSQIDGDPSLGDGPREYATIHASPNADLIHTVVPRMQKTAEFLKWLGFNVVRQKVELVMYDTKGREQ